MTRGGEGPGSFDDELVLDEDFVRGANVRELTAEDRARRAQRVADQARELEEQKAQFAAARKRAKRARRPHRRLAAAIPRANPKKILGTLLILGLIGAGLRYTNGIDQEATDASLELGRRRPRRSPTGSGRRRPRQRRWRG